MDKYEIVKRIENFAPLDTQEDWDCSGFGVDVSGRDEISKIMLCLTVTEDVVKQAGAKNCDMIISHHPLFFVPLEWRDINIYSAHTNMDLAYGGTTDTFIDNLGLTNQKEQASDGFLRYVDLDISIFDFCKILKVVSPNMRYVNNKGVNRLKRIAFCAGSGSDFIQEAFENGADALVTGDLKFHTALESPIVVFDVGHFESEIGVLKVFESLLDGVEICYAKEQSPFLTM